MINVVFDVGLNSFALPGPSCESSYQEHTVKKEVPTALDPKHNVTTNIFLLSSERFSNTTCNKEDEVIETIRRIILRQFRKKSKDTHMNMTDTVGKLTSSQKPQKNPAEGFDKPDPPGPVN